jgi:tetratricopeptide (TPR) repeat protein
MKFNWAELRRRRVIRVTIAYVVAAWLLVEVGDTLFDMLDLPGWMDRALLAVLALGLPLAIVLAWVFDITPEGNVERTKKAGAESGTKDTDSSHGNATAPPDPRRFEFADLGRINLDQLDLGRPQLTPLCGRTEECQLIEKRLDEAVQGRGGIVFIGGAPGEGKTRLGEEALELGLRRGMLPLLGQAYEEHGAPFIISTEIIEDIQRALPVEVLRNALGDTASEIARLVPDLRRAMPDIPPPETLPAEQQQRYFFNAMLEFTGRLASACPLVYLLDDMQWADESSVALLEHVARQIHRMPALIVVTYRDVAADMREPFKHALSRLAHQDYATRIHLKPLGEAAVSEVIEGIYGEAAPASLVALIHRSTGGNAFFAKSLFQHLAEEGELFDANGNWREDLESRDLPIPDGIRYVIERRLVRLGDDKIAVMSAGAVEGLRFNLRTLELALADAGNVETSINAESVLAAVEAAEKAGLVFATGEERAVRYEFAHALVRQALLDDLSAGRLQRLHRRLGNALESMHGDAPSHSADIAHHYYRAGELVDSKRTLRFLVLSGERALETAAADEAVQAFSRALELEEHEEARAEHLFKRGLAHRTAGDAIRGGEDWLKALPVFERVPDPDRVAEICWALGYVYAWDNKMLEAEQLVRRGLAVVGDGPSRARCHLMAMLGMTVGERLDFDLWERTSAEAIAMARDLDDDVLLTEALMGRQYVGEHWYEADLHLEAAEEAITVAKRVGSYELAGTLGAALVGWMKALDFDRIDAHWQECRDLSRKYGDLGNVMHGELVHAVTLLQRGRLADAREIMDRLAQWSREVNFAWGTIIIEMTGFVAFLQGDWERAREIYAEANTTPIKGTMAGVEPAYQAAFLAYADDPGAEAALKAIEPRAAIAGQRNQLGAWGTSAALLEARAVRGEREACAAYYDVMVQLEAAGTHLAWNRGLVSTLAGVTAAAGGQWSKAEAHFKTSEEFIERYDLDLAAAELLRWRAQAQLWQNESDERNQAEALLERAAEAYRTLGMPRHVALTLRHLQIP